MMSCSQNQYKNANFSKKFLELQEIGQRANQVNAGFDAGG